MRMHELLLNTSKGNKLKHTTEARHTVNDSMYMKFKNRQDHL